MSTQSFESIEDINKHYDRQLRDAEDDLSKANLRAEKAERVSEFRERQAADSQRQAWVAQAVAQHKIDPEMSDLIQGSTAEEINAKAERLAKLSAPPAPTAADLYGADSAGGGGAAPNQKSKDPVGDGLTAFEEKFNAGEQMSPLEYQRYVRERLGRQAFAGMREFGKKNLWHGAELKDIPEYERT